MKLPNEIVKTIFIPVKIGRVWAAITQPEGLSKWFGDRATLTLKPNAPIVIEWDAYGTATGEVEKVEPPHHFSFRWRAHGVAAAEPLTAANSTLVQFTLTEMDGGTELTVVETGFAHLHTAARQANYKENVSGWHIELQELLDYLTGSAA